MMKKSRIYRLAYYQLERDKAFEESKLKSFPDNEATKARIERMSEELEEIIDLIVDAEANAE